MSFLKFFSSAQPNDRDRQKEIACLQEIISAVSRRTGVADFIHYDDHSVAFSGSKERMELFLTIFTQKYDGKKYLYASLDDEVSWQEWDFDNPADFQANIIEHLAGRVNRTVKTVIEKEKHQSYRQSAYYLDEATNEWILFEDAYTQNALICLIAANKSEKTETIKTYKLDMR